MKKYPGVVAVANDLIKNTILLTDEKCPFSYHQDNGNKHFLLMAGDNASGKSLLASMIASRSYHDYQVEPMVVSMGARTSEGMGRAFTYGQENTRATGEVSLSVTMKALGGLESRVKDGKAAMAILDEPDFGLAEGFAYAFGQKIARAVNNLPDGNWDVVLVSHSREMARGIVDTLEEKPSFIHAGENMILGEWLLPPERKSVDELDAMMDLAKNRSKIVNDITRKKTENKKSESTKSAKKPR